MSNQALGEIRITHGTLGAFLDKVLDPSKTVRVRGGGGGADFVSLIGERLDGLFPERDTRSDIHI